MSDTPTDSPPPAAARGRVEPAPRRVRGFAGRDLVFDTTAARYVWEIPYYPQYYVPLADVHTEFLADLKHQMFDENDGPLAGLVRFEWDTLTWFEEDERIHVHPRNPYARVDALRSRRHIVVELDGVVLADTRTPVLVFETGLPTRYYIDRIDVRFEHLEPSDTRTRCPYKGETSEYWSVRGSGKLAPDLAWSYDYPLAAVAAIAGAVAFYNEKVDITVDGVRLPRPRTKFS